MKDSSTSTARGAYGRLVLLSIAIMLIAGLGCDALGCGGGVPDSSAERVEDMAEHLPQDTPFSLVVSDLKGMRTSLEKTRDTLGDTVPTDLFTEQVKNELGIDVFDPESWKKSGIDPNSGLTVSIAGKRPVFLTYIADQQKFEKSFADQLKKSMDIEGMPKNEKVDGAQVKVLGKDDKTVAWTYDDKLLIAAFPESPDMADYANEAEKDPKKLVAQLAGLDSAKSLASLDSYKKFNKALAAEQSTALFINMNEALKKEQVEGLKQTLGEAQGTWIEKNIDAAGISMNVDGNKMKFRTWAALPEKVSKRAQEIMTPPTDAPIENFATANTMLGLRTSVDMQKWWAFYKETMPEADRKKVMQSFEQIAQQANLDFEKDVINKLTGNIGVVFYGVKTDMLEQAQGNPTRALMMNGSKFLELAVPLQFKDKAAVDKVLEGLASAMQGSISRTDVGDGVQQIEIKNVKRPFGKILVKDTLLVYATGGVPTEDVAAYINGKSEQKAMGDKLDLGKEFATAEKYNGLYVNFMRAQKQLGDVLAQQQPQAAEFLKKVEEAALTSEADDTGFFIDLTIDLTPTKGGDKGDDKKE